VNRPSVPSKESAAGADGDGEDEGVGEDEDEGAAVGDAIADWLAVGTADEGDTFVAGDGVADAGAGDGVDPQAAATTASTRAKVAAVARRQ
jgi:hypothetical protein